MQYPDDAELAEAINSRSRRFSARLMVDWNRDGQFDHPYSDLSKLVVEVTTDRTMEGALPAEATLVDGFSAAQLTVELAGRLAHGEPNAAQLLSPYSLDSPLYGVTRKGTPVRYSILVQTSTGSVELRQFTGRLRETVVDSAEGSATLRCLDFAEDMRFPITLPVYAHKQTSDERNLFNSQWVIDWILRQGGYRQSPPLVPGVRFSATMHGAAIPEGVQNFWTFDTPPSEKPWRPGKYGLALYVDATTGRGVFEGRPYIANLEPSNGNTFGWGAWIEGPVTNAATGSGGRSTEMYTVFAGGADPIIGLHVSATNQLQAFIDNAGSPYRVVTGPTITGPTAWHYVGVEMTCTSTSTAIRFNLDGVVTAATTDAVPPITLPRADIFTVFAGRPIQCIQHWQGTATNNWSYAPDFVPNAVLSEGMNKLSHLPTVVNENAWDVLKEIVHAEFGTLYADEDGVARFLNREESRQSKTTVDREIGPDHLKNVTLTDSSDTIVNVIATTTRLGIYKDRITAWEATNNDQLTFNPGIWDVTVEDVDDVMAFYSNVTYISNGNTTEGWKEGQPIQGFFPVHATNGTAAGNVTVSVTELSQRSFRYRVINNNAFAIRLADRANTNPDYPGSPRLRIGAWGVVYLPEKRSTVENQASIDVHGRRAWSLPATRWSQSYSSMRYIASNVLAELGQPLPVLDRISIPGDPRLQLMDAVPIRDPEGLGDRLNSQVIGIRRTLNSNGLFDDLSTRLLSSPGEWVLGDTAYSVLGETTALST